MRPRCRAVLAARVQMVKRQSIMYYAFGQMGDFLCIRMSKAPALERHGSPSRP